jgi:hypothetical protein
MRHYTEEELLMHVLQEETPELAGVIADHLSRCRECRAVFREYESLVGRIVRWRAAEPAESRWRNLERNLLTQYRKDRDWLQQGRWTRTIRRWVGRAWDYALENPLPTMGYVAAALAFASERTITIFRLDKLLPGASDLFEILKQVL